MNEIIVSVAVRWNGLIFSLPSPHRHHHVCHKMYESGLPIDAQRDQGFLTSTGRYVDREEGCIIATKANQIIKKTHPLYELFSEDLW